MKHLKKFNEELRNENDLEVAFSNAKITPLGDKVSISSVYSLVVILLDRPVEFDDDMTNMIAFRFVNDVPEFVHLPDIGDQRDQFILDGQHRFGDKFVNLLEYNDINYQEIENILLEFDLSVEDIWGVLK